MNLKDGVDMSEKSVEVLCELLESAIGELLLIDKYLLPISLSSLYNVWLRASIDHSSELCS